MAQKKECPSCAMMVDKHDRVCPVCSYEFPDTRTGFRIGAVLLIIVFLAYMLFFFFR